MIFYYYGRVAGGFEYAFTLQYLTGKLGECVQYYPELKEEAQDIYGSFALE